MTRRRQARPTTFGLYKWPACGVPYDYGTSSTVCSLSLSLGIFSFRPCGDAERPQSHPPTQCSLL